MRVFVIVLTVALTGCLGAESQPDEPSDIVDLAHYTEYVVYLGTGGSNISYSWASDDARCEWAPVRSDLLSVYKVPEGESYRWKKSASQSFSGCNYSNEFFATDNASRSGEVEDYTTHWELRFIGTVEITYSLA